MIATIRYPSSRIRERILALIQPSPSIELILDSSQAPNTCLVITREGRQTIKFEDTTESGDELPVVPHAQARLCEAQPNNTRTTATAL